MFNVITKDGTMHRAIRKANVSKDGLWCLAEYGCAFFRIKDIDFIETEEDDTVERYGHTIPNYKDDVDGYYTVKGFKEREKKAQEEREKS